MTQTLFQKEDPLNLGGGWSAYRRRRRGAPISKRRYSYGPKPGYEPPRKKPKQPPGPGPWFQPLRRPCWYPSWGRCGGPWRPPPAGFRKPPCPLELMRVFGLHPLCPCCCSCWCAPWNPGWARPPGRKKRWGRRGRLRRPPRGSFPRRPPVDLSMLLRPVNLYGWRAPGMRAPRNTTQFIMNQVYQDLRQQEKLERRQRAQRAQRGRAGSSGDDAPPGGGEESAALPDTFYGLWQDPSLVLSPAPPAPGQEKEPPAPQLLEAEEEIKEEERQEGRLGECRAQEEYEEEESEEVEAESEEEEEAGTEDEDGEEEEEVKEGEHEEEGNEEEEKAAEDQGPEGEQRDKENHFPLEMPLSILGGAEEEEEEGGKDFMSYTYLSLDQMIPDVPQETLFMIPDIDH